jgi:hypothetical protein
MRPHIVKKNVWDMDLPELRHELRNLALLRMDFPIDAGISYQYDNVARLISLQETSTAEAV